jgi:histidine triad (HIT) family protein
MTTECLFCQIAEGTTPSDIVYQDNATIAFRDINPQAPTHVLIIPREHIESFHHVRDAQLWYAILQTAHKVAEQEGISGGYRIVSNVGTAAGQSVEHVHIHLLGGRQMSWPPG